MNSWNVWVRFFFQPRLSWTFVEAGPSIWRVGWTLKLATEIYIQRPETPCKTICLLGPSVSAGTPILQSSHPQHGTADAMVLNPPMPVPPMARSARSAGCTAMFPWARMGCRSPRTNKVHLGHPERLRSCFPHLGRWGLASIRLPGFLQAVYRWWKCPCWVFT